MKHEEAKIQEHCINWFRYQHNRLARLMWHTPNGGARNPKEGAHFKRIGVVAGVPDLFLAVPREPYHGMFLELKTDKGQLRDTQKEMRKQLMHQGYKWALVRSLDDFIEAVENYLNGEKVDFEAKNKQNNPYTERNNGKHREQTSTGN